MLNIGQSLRFDVPDNDHGLDIKLGYLRDMVHQSVQTPDVMEVAQRIAGGAETDREVIERVHTFLQQNMTYTPDTEASEVFIAPHRQIAKITRGENGTGDCDDYTILGMALLYNLGIPTRPIVVQTATSEDGEYNHIYFEAYDRESKKWIASDAVRKTRRVGLTANIVRRREYPVIK